MKRTSSTTPPTTGWPIDAQSHPGLFRQVMQASGVAMAIRDTTLKPLFANQAFLDICGRTLEECQNSTREDNLPKVTLDLQNEVIRPALFRGESWEGEFAIRLKNGRLRSVWARFDPVSDASGEVTSVISVMRDASASRRLRNALSQTERHLKFLSDNTSDCLFRLRLTDAGYDYISPAAENITGYTQQEFYETDRMIHTLTMPGWHDKLNQWWEELKNGVNRYEYEWPIMHRDGSIRWVNQRTTLVYDDNGTPIAIEGISTDITERRKVQEELTTARKSLHFISNSTSDIFFRMNIPEGTYDYLSPSVERFSGYSLAEYAETPLLIRQIIHPDWIDYFDESWDEMCRGISRPDYEFQFIHKSGETRWASQRVVLHFDDHGTPVALEGIATDITERKRAEEALRKSENRFRVLFEESPISLWEEDLTRLKGFFDELKEQGVTDFRHHFYSHPEDLAKCAECVDVVSVNRATLDLLRAKSQEDLLGNLHKVLTESSMAAFTEEMILLASGGCEYCGEITHRTLDGEEIWVVVHFIVPDEYRDTLSRVIVSLLDVTPRKRAEEALLESEQRYRALVENSQEGVVVTRDGTPLFINEAMTTVTGFSPEELKTMRIEDFVHQEDAERVKRQVDSFALGEEKNTFTSFRILTKDGRIKWLTLSIKSIHWSGEPARLKIFTDVTVHKTLEDELRAAHAEMEDRVQLRTVELSEANIKLLREADERERDQAHIQALTQQLIRAQEDERQRISRDLHDKVAQDLSSIVLKMETIFDDHPDTSAEARESVAQLADIVRGAVASVRDISYGLSPSGLKQLGLPRSLDNLCQATARRCSAEIDFFATGMEDLPLDFDMEINIFRMVQEAINNMVKHSRANRCAVRLVKSHPNILIRIEDNGTGFDVTRRMAETVEEQRMALRSMEERARLLGGSMEMQSVKGKGTRIVFNIPITKARRL